MTVLLVQLPQCHTRWNALKTNKIIITRSFDVSPPLWWDLQVHELLKFQAPPEGGCRAAACLFLQGSPSCSHESQIPTEGGVILPSWADEAFWPSPQSTQEGLPCCPSRIGSFHKQKCWGGLDGRHEVHFPGPENWKLLMETGLQVTKMEKVEGKPEHLTYQATLQRQKHPAPPRPVWSTQQQLRPAKVFGG